MSATGAPGFEAVDLFRLRLRRDRNHRACRTGERRQFTLQETIDPDDSLLAALDRLGALGVGFDELPLHVALLDRNDRSPQGLDMRQLFLHCRFQLVYLPGNYGRAVENVV